GGRTVRTEPDHLAVRRSELRVGDSGWGDAGGSGLPDRERQRVAEGADEPGDTVCGELRPGRGWPGGCSGELGGYRGLQAAGTERAGREGPGGGEELLSAGV